MCGIAGFTGSFNEGLLTAMGDRIAHRGPDGRGQILLQGRNAPAVGLAHRRLSIIDLSDAGSQPMTVRCECCGVSPSAPPNARLWITYNGELYNYPELKADLVSAGHTFHSESDTEVLLHLYAERGPSMLESLNGIFAFALYDGRSGGQHEGIQPGDVLVARDPLGVKPLYFADCPSGILFASELKALLCATELPRELDLVAIHQYLTYLWCPAPRTPLRAIRKLEMGEAMLLRNSRIERHWSYYDLPYGQPLHRGTEAQISKELASQVEESVRRQLVSDVEVGAFLSGGLDSSAVVAMMRKLHPERRIRAYCIAFASEEDLDGTPVDLPYAQRVAKDLDIDLDVIQIGPEIIEHLEEQIFFLDEPQADPAPINALLISRAARRDGIKVLMSGAGGDDIFTGYGRHRALRIEKLWSRMPQVMRRALAAPARAAFNGRGPNLMHDIRIRQAAKLLAHADLNGDERLISYFYWGGEDIRRSLFGPDMQEALRDEWVGKPLQKTLDRIPEETDAINRMLYLEGRHFLADHNLNYTDKVGMAAGVEIRVPLLDPDLVDFATRIPPGMKQQGGEGKAIFKKAMEPSLPRDVIYRQKVGFGAPVRRWLAGELRGRVEEMLSPDSIRQRGLFDPEGVARLLRLNKEKRIDGSFNLLALLSIEMWCRRFLDQNGAPPSAP